MANMQSDKDGFFTIDGRRVRINDDGSITALDGKDVATQTAADQEHADLDYFINNHPDRLDDVDAARACRDELNTELGIDNTPTALADKRKQLRAGILKAQMRAKMVDTVQSKQND